MPPASRLATRPVPEGALVRFEALSTSVNHLAQGTAGASTTPLVLRRWRCPAPHSAQAVTVTISFIHIPTIGTLIGWVLRLVTMTRVWVVAKRKIFWTIDTFVRFNRFSRRMIDHRDAFAVSKSVFITAMFITSRFRALATGTFYYLIGDAQFRVAVAPFAVLTFRTDSWTDIVETFAAVLRGAKTVIRAGRVPLVGSTLSVFDAFSIAKKFTLFTGVDANVFTLTRLKLRLANTPTTGVTSALRCTGLCCLSRTLRS